MIASLAPSFIDFTPRLFTLIVAAPVFVKFALKTTTSQAAYAAYWESIVRRYAFADPVELA